MEKQNAALAIPVPSGGSRPKKRNTLSKLSVYLWILPSLLLILFIVIVPVIILFHTSFSQVSEAGIVRGFNNFKNYTALFQDGTFLMVLKNTLIWTVVVVGVSTVLSLAISLLLNKDFRGRSIVRAAIILPWATSLVVMASIWKWIFDYNYGTLNLILKSLGLIANNIYWLALPSSSFPVLLWAGIYDTMPFTIIVFLAGLQAIPVTLYESANIDGAGGWAKFIHITLPMLKQSLTITTVLNIIYVFNAFPIIWTITRGEPLNQTDTIVTYLYKQAFQKNQIGQASAISVIGFVILMAFSMLYISLTRRSDDQ